MREYAFDFHLHSCLSPCGDEAMTPADLAGMCALAGYDAVALTDHNTVGNCAAFCRAAAHYGILALPGMELTTAEEIHVVCLFPDLDRALVFGDHVRAHLPPIQNRPDYFGRQILMDEEGHVTGEETALLIGATDIPYSSVHALVSRFDGVCWPAHIDHSAFSLLSNLGLWLPEAGFRWAELSLTCPPGFTDRPDLEGVKFLTGCDAHSLHEIPDPSQTLLLSRLTPETLLNYFKS